MVRCPQPDVWFALDGANDELVGHLDGCAECRGVAAMIARADVLEHVSMDGVAEGLVPELLPSGAQLGRYVVRGAIGAGGMGVVLEAHDPKLDRRVALKVVRRLRDDAGWARAKERVLDEAQAMARLAHPNVIAIHDLVEIGDEQLIAMELVDGPDLEAWLATSPPPRERRRVMLEVARGLAAAHDAGVVHRDVKPSNIMIGADGRARVTDFGLAALEGAPTSGAIGTPGFLAPEVIDGSAADARSDQYAFAVTAWRTLFDAEPGERGRGGPVASALERALEREPAERWPSMHELVHALEGRTQRGRGVAIGVSAITVVAATIGVVWWHRATDATTACIVDDAPLTAVWSPPARTAWLAKLRVVAGAGAEPLVTNVDRAWAQWREASRAACGMPAAVTDCLATTRRRLTAYVTHAPASQHASAAEAALADIPNAWLCLRPPEQQPLEVAPGLRVARAPFKFALDEVSMLMSLGQYGEANRRIDALIALAPAADPALRGELLYVKADAMGRTGDDAGSVGVLEEALAIAERVGNDVARLDAMILLLSAYEELGKVDEATALARVAEAAAERVPRNPKVAARLATVLGNLAYNAGDHATAERHYAEVVRLQEEMHGLSAPSLAGALHNYGLAIHMAGRIDEATKVQERALAMFEATVGPDHPDTALPVTELAGLALEQGHLEDAVRLYERGLAIREHALGATHPYLSETLLGLARAQSQRGKSDEAIAALRRARTLGLALGENNPLVASVEYWLADELDHRKQPAEVTGLLEHALAAWDANQVVLPEAGFTRFLLAKYLWRAGDRMRAHRLAQQAHTALAELAAPYADSAKEVETWLATH